MSQGKYVAKTKKNKLASWMQSEGISIKKLAIMIGVDYYTVRKYVANERAPLLFLAIIIEELTNGAVPCTSWFDLAARKPAKKRANKKKDGHAKKRTNNR